MADTLGRHHPHLRPSGGEGTNRLPSIGHELLAARHPLAATVPVTAHFLRVVYASPTLKGRALEQSREIADTLKSLLAEETGALDAELMANLLTTTIDSIHARAAARMLAGDDSDGVHHDRAAVIARAFDLVEHGIGSGE